MLSATDGMTQWPKKPEDSVCNASVSRGDSGVTQKEAVVGTPRVLSQWRKQPRAAIGAAAPHPLCWGDPKVPALLALQGRQDHPGCRQLRALSQAPPAHPHP